MSRTLKPQVYFVEIGKHIKIGFTTNLAARLKSFLTSAASVELLLAIPGDRDLEARLHTLFSECRIAREIFHRDYRISNFISYFEMRGLEAAIQYLEATTPEARYRKKVEDREHRTLVARQSKAEKDAYFASLVAERKARIGR